MKIKEIDRTANVAWSPVEVDPVYLAVGTAAQQMDSSSSTSASLELYQFDIHQGGLDLPVKATLSCENRFHKLIWGSNGIAGGEHGMGVIVGGCDGGVMQVYDAAKVLKNENPLILTKTKHTGPVRALDFNPFRSNLVASGASDSEIFIWDLTNPKTPMTPGTKVQPSDDVSHLAWNKQVEHILASTFSTRCVVWDLRKNEPVIKVSDTTSRIRYKVVEWHPDIATQMCLASEDDNSPVIQLWDLRYATAPLKVIQGHQSGILGMAWCPQDSDLLLSCGKEARILCWNPNFPHPGYEMVCDIPTSSQYSFDISFCPKNPVVIASSSYDGRVSIFGLSGGVQHPITSSKLADSFPGMDMTLSTPLPSQQPAFLQLRDAPKWLKRPCGATFGFGGKLITFSNTKTPSAQPGQPPSVTSVVSVSQLVTLPSLIERSKKLEETLQSGSLEYFCTEKAQESTDPNETQIWEFLQANFSQNPRQEYLSKLGFNAAEMLAKLDETTSESITNGAADEFEALGRGAPDGYSKFSTDFPSSFGKLTLEPETELKVPTDDNSVDGKINQALLCGSIDTAVNLCLEGERWADALLLATKASPETLLKVKNKYFQKCQNEATQMIRAVVSHDFTKIVERCSLNSWKQVLAVITTYSDNKEFPVLADMLGQRLQNSSDESQKLGALLCCICSGNLNHLVDVWISDSDKHRGNTPDELQDLFEQIMILKKAGEMWGRDNQIDGRSLGSKLAQYSGLLASQGCLELALSFLGDCNDPEVESLKETLYSALRCPRPAKVARQSINSIQSRGRSRQTSESGSFSFNKRPSYPGSGVVQQPLFNNSEFDNLVGPVHPPSYASSQTSAYGNLYVNPNSPPVVGQYSPQTYGSVYNPSDAPPASNMSPVKDHKERIPLGSSLPRPPVSSAAHGWNDPPPMKASNRPKPASTASTEQPITHPIFGTAPPEPSRPDPYGSNMYGNSQMMPPQSAQPPPPPPSMYNPSVPAFSNPGSFGQQPTPASSYGPPPPMGQSYTSPGQSTFTPAPFAPPQSASYPPPPQTATSGTSSLPPSNGPYGRPLSQNRFPYQQPQAPNTTTPVTTGPPPASMKVGPPPSINSLPLSSQTPSNSFQPLNEPFPRPPSQNRFPYPQATNQTTGPPPTSLNSFPPPSMNSFPPPSTNSFPTTSSMNSFPPPSTNSFPPPSMNSFQSASINSFGPPPPTSVSAPLPPPQTMSFQPLPPTPISSPNSFPLSSAPLARPPSQNMFPYPQATNPTPPASTNLFSPPPSSNQNFPPQPNTQFSNNSPYTPQPPTNMYSPSPTNQQFNNPSMNPQGNDVNQNQFMPNPASPFQPINPPTPTPPPANVDPPKPLGPIPPEHLTLVDTLEKLRSECYEVAHLVQMKRKLEDVARKLEVFSEKLKIGCLTESTLNALHSLVDALRAKDYQTALQLHTQLVTAGNFAEISTFLPAIKVLIQSAIQLEV